MPQQVIIPGFPKYGYMDGVHTIATKFQHFTFLSKAFFVVIQLNRFQFYIVTIFFFIFLFFNRLKDSQTCIRQYPYLDGAHYSTMNDFKMFAYSTEICFKPYYPSRQTLLTLLQAMFNIFVH